MRWLLVAVAFGLAAPALAQIGLPTLPDVGGLTRPLPDVGVNVPLRDLRALQVRELLRTHRNALEADPQGEVIVRARVLAAAPSEAALEAALNEGFSVESRDQIEGVGALIIMRTPRGMSTRRALRVLRARDPAGVYDFDHVHLPSGQAPAAVDAPDAARAASSGDKRIGLIDSGVPNTARFAAAIIEQGGFGAARAAPGAHGEAVAALLIAGGDVRLYVADIYGGEPTGGSSSAMARALGWLAQRDIPVINISLVGPRNRVVEAVIGQLVRRGFAIVAAVGNDGPAAPPLYPASYPGVVGVTGVDARARLAGGRARSASGFRRTRRDRNPALARHVIRRADRSASLGGADGRAGARCRAARARSSGRASARSRRARPRRRLWRGPRRRIRIFLQRRKNLLNPRVSSSNPIWGGIGKEEKGL